MAKKKSAGNNSKKVKLTKRKCANVFKAKASSRHKLIGKEVSTTLRKNVMQAKRVEKINNSFEKNKTLILMGKKEKSNTIVLQKQNQDGVSESQIDDTSNMLESL